MENVINLPALLNASEVTAWSAAIAAITGIVQQLSFVPIPEGSRARAWTVSLLAALIIALLVPGSGQEGAPLILAMLLSWSALAGAALAFNRAGVATANAVRDSNP